MRFSDPLPLPAVRASRSLPSSAALVVLAALIALVATALAPSPAAAYEKRLICGTNMAYLDASGHAFYYDLPYTQALGYGRIGGFALADTTAVPFGGTPDRTLYINGRYTWDEYRFDVPNGDYLVRLHFADRVETGPGFRAFDISIEGALVLDDYDVIADAGDPYYVVRPTFAATVTDGQLNVVCTQNTAESHIEAIEVLSWPQEVDPPSTPGGLDAQDSYHRISIDWDDAPEEDVAGYILERSTAAGGPYTPVTAAPIRNSRYHDDDVVLGTPYYYRVAAVDIWDNQSAFSSEVSGLVRADGSSTLPVYEITLDPADYQALLADPLSDEYKHGTFRYQGQVWEDVGVRFRGRISRFLPKKSWKVKFNEFVPGQLFLDGQEELNLNAHHGEQTLLREALAYHVEREAGVPASNARHAHLQLNDTYLGVFTEAEQVDERWLENRGFNSSGNLYKSEDGDLTVLADSLAYTLSYSKKTNRNEGYEDLITFIELINETPPESVYTRLAPVFDIEGWINYYATQIAIGNDSFFSHNYYLYHDLVNDMWHYLPWDLDSTWGHLGAYHAGVVDSVSVLHGLTANGLITQLYQGTLLNSGHYLRRYLDRVLEILEDVMDPVLLDPVIDDYHAKMVTDARLDWHKWGWESSEWVDQGNVELESFLPARAAYVQLRHAALAPPQDLWFNEIMADNDNVIQDEFGDYDDWFELYNAGTVAIDLSGHFMTDDPAQPMQWALPDTTIQPGGFLLFWADGEPLEGPTHTNFRLDYDGEFLGLFAPVADGNYPVETTSWGFQYKNVSVGRYPDGGYNWKLMPNPTPAATNIEGGNLPPDVGDTQRDPLNVGVNVPVTVTTTASDPDGIAAVTLHYDLGTVFESTPMFDDGQHGDGAAGDGVWGGTIPGRPEYGFVYFYVEAEDNLGATSTDPRDAPVDLFVYEVGYVPPLLVVNEFMALNDTTIADEWGEFDDWVEILNADATPLELGGLRLSDNFLIPDKYAFPDTTLLPGEYLLVWCDNDPGQGPYHADFRLSAGGERIALFGDPATGFAVIDSLTFAAQYPDTSYGRYPNGTGAWQFFYPATPGAPNMLPVGVDPEAPAAPRVFQFGPLAPNPFDRRLGRALSVPFALPDRRHVRLLVYDVMGRAVSRVVDRSFEPGYHELTWDGDTARAGRAASGIYFMRLEAGNESRTAKIVVLR